MSKNIRVGVVGAGSNTRQRHIPGFQAIEGVEVVSVANRTRESSQRVADEFQIPEVYDNWAELIAAPDTNAICIGTWPYMHRTLVLEALKNDKHVLTEARMAMTAREAREMLDASHSKPHLVAQVVPYPVTLKVDSTIKNLIDQGYLGDILSVDLTALDVVTQQGFIDRDAAMRWSHDRDFAGYNMMLLGAWYEAMMRWIGPASSVIAITRTYVPSRVDESGKRRVVTVPDHAEVLCEMASGPVAHMRLSEVTGLIPRIFPPEEIDLPAAMPPGEVQAGLRIDRVWFYGTEGTLLLECGVDAGDVWLFGGRRGDNKLQRISVPPEKQGHWRVEQEFVNAIRGVEPVVHTTFADGLKYMEFTEAVTRSAQSGRRVHLPL